MRTFQTDPKGLELNLAEPSWLFKLIRGQLNHCVSRLASVLRNLLGKGFVKIEGSNPSCSSGIVPLRLGDIRQLFPSVSLQVTPVSETRSPRKLGAPNSFSG